MKLEEQKGEWERAKDKKTHKKKDGKRLWQGVTEGVRKQNRTVRWRVREMENTKKKEGDIESEW
jgi:hypothetical protein